MGGAQTTTRKLVRAARTEELRQKFAQEGQTMTTKRPVPTLPSLEGLRNMFSWMQHCRQDTGRFERAMDVLFPGWRK